MTDITTNTTTATLPSRLRAALLTHATLDALGAPLEFHPRHSFPTTVTTMLPNANFNLPPGCFTDDTSMALCLTYSLLGNGPEDYADQARRYILWWREGWWSSVSGRGACFDIGMGTRAALGVWEGVLDARGGGGGEEEEGMVEKVGGEGEGEKAEEQQQQQQQQGLQEVRRGFSGEYDCGNGSLMRVLPVALLYYADPNVQILERVAKGSSAVTHPHERCGLCCALFVRVVRLALLGNGKEELAAEVGRFVDELKDGEAGVDKPFIERFEGYRTVADWEGEQEEDIKSSGYVLDSLEAALWAFFTTPTLREGGIKVVNLGDDADTVGAIHGGLAGAFYGEDAIPKQWLDAMVGLKMVKEAADSIVAATERRMAASSKS